MNVYGLDNNDGKTLKISQKQIKYAKSKNAAHCTKLKQDRLKVTKLISRSHYLHNKSLTCIISPQC